MESTLKQNKSAYQLVLIGQVLLFFFLFVCIAIIPHFLFEANEGGISNYALYAKTIIPFSLSTISGAAFAYVACQFIPDKPGSLRKLKLYTRLWAAFALISLISTYPYKVNHLYGDLHQYISILFVLYEMWFAGWLAFVLAKDRINVYVWVIQVIGFILGVLNYFGVIHVLFIVEIWEGLAFAIILVRSVRRLLIT